MRAVLWIVAIIALATSLDASLYGGNFTRAADQMITDIARHFR